VTVVDGLAELRAPYRDAQPEHLNREDARKQGGEFDANSYFTVLKHLSLPPGAVLDWVQYFGGIGAEPILYVRDAQALPWETYKAYRAAGGPATIEDPSTEALSKVLTDDTPEGYLELAILHLTAVDFYRFWHAGYRDWQVVCNRKQLDEVAAEVQTVFGALFEWMGTVQPPAQATEAAQRAEQMGFSLEPYKPQASDDVLRPKVRLDEETATVTVSYFTKWGGLIRQTFVYPRRPPHTRDQLEPERLEEWMIPIVF
jgi:hypothetical protein